MLTKKIGIIGCGNMGEALLRHLSTVVEKSAQLMVSELDASRRDLLRSKYRIIVEIDNNSVVKFADVIILAVKPQDLDAVLRGEVCCGVSKDKLLVSIAAGVTTKRIEKIVGKDVPVIRAMPNMAAKIGESITSLSAGSSASASHMEIAKEIFSTIGDVVEIDEKHVDAATAVSGSGPAYFYYLIESLVAAAVKADMTKEIAERLVLKTASGSIKLLEALKEDPVSLRKQVASKGGTTEAAFRVLEARKFKKIIIDAVKAARKRSKELSGR
jgi:pyrroline-5-carboxylate reductase